MAIKEFIPEIWIRSSKSYAERVIEDNFALLLSLVPDGYKFKLASDGHIIVKPEYEEEFENEAWGGETSEISTNEQQPTDLQGASASAPQPKPTIPSQNFRPSVWMRGGYRGGRGKSNRGRTGNRGFRGGNRGGYRGGYRGRSWGTPNPLNSSGQHHVSDSEFPKLPTGGTPGSATKPANKKPRQFSPEANQNVQVLDGIESQNGDGGTETALDVNTQKDVDPAKADGRPM